MRIQKREQSKRAQRGIAKGILTAACMAVMVWCMPIVSLADATGKVIPNSVNIRKTPDVNSEVVGSSTIGKEVTIKGKVNASGTTWYQVYVSGSTLGYIRADMIEPEAEAEIPVVTMSEGESSGTEQQGGDASQETAAGDAGTAQPDTSSGGAQVAADESVDLQYAKIKVHGKVRPEPSTKQNSVGGLSAGASVVVSGKSAGSDGKTWYYVTYTSDNGSEKTGFVREDLLEMGEMLPQEEEPPQEEAPVEVPEPEPVVNNDYELRLEQTESGPVWYLDDHIRGETKELSTLLGADSPSEDEEEAAAAVVKQRIVIVVLVVLLVALIVTVVIMSLKLRDAYYEDYDDDDDEDDEDEEDDEEEEERPVRRRGRMEEPEDERPVRRREMQRDGERRRNSERSGRSERSERVERTERRVPRERSYEDNPSQDRAAKSAPKRKSKNFLLDDDEFEFEFLNMEDKDLM